MLRTDIAALALFACFSPQEGAVGGPRGDAPDKGRAMLNAWLERFPDLPKTEIDGCKIAALDDASIRLVFPGDRFYGVHYYVDYPRPKAIRGEMRLHNLIHVRLDGAVERVADRGALQTLFEKRVAPARDEAQARAAAAACVLVAEEFFQDGLYTFQDPDVKVTRDGDDLVARAEAKVKTRGTGTVSVTLTFKPSAGVAVIIDGHVRPDVRRR